MAEATHVKCMNTKSGVPQVLPKHTWDWIHKNNHDTKNYLEKLHDCDAQGNSIEEVPVTDTPPQKKPRKKKADTEEKNDSPTNNE